MLLLRKMRPTRVTRLPDRRAIVERHHAAELINRERASIEARSMLPEEHRAATVDLDDAGDEHEERHQHDQAETREYDV
jgi:hypothetical protein